MNNKEKYCYNLEVQLSFYIYSKTISMGFLSKLLGNDESTPNLSKEELLEAEVCPNCWGKQDYDNKFIQYTKDQVKANLNNDKTAKKAFVQQFVETNITGIRLKKDGDQLVCNSCNATHKTVSSKAN